MTIETSQPDPAFLGRRDELASLADQLTSAARNGTQVVVIGGDPGIGKSTLLHTLSARHPVAARHVTVRCSPYDVDGLQPILRLIAALEPEEPLPPPPAATDPPATDPEQARARRSERFTSLLAALLDRVGSAPTVVALDDIHWGQPLLHEFLAFTVHELLTHRRLRHRLLLILITRILPPPHPVATLLTDLERHLDVPRIELGPLTADEIGQLVTTTATRPSPAYVDLVQRSARGNPLRAQAALRTLIRRRIDSTIRPSDPRAWGEIHLPPELSDPVTAWISTLPAPVRKTLAAGALWTDELTPDDLLPLLIDHTPAEIGRHLQDAVSIELLETDGRYY